MKYVYGQQVSNTTGSNKEHLGEAESFRRWRKLWIFHHLLCIPSSKDSDCCKLWAHRAALICCLWPIVDTISIIIYIWVAVESDFNPNISFIVNAFGHNYNVTKNFTCIMTCLVQNVCSSSMSKSCAYPGGAGCLCFLGLMKNLTQDKVKWCGFWVTLPPAESLFLWITLWWAPFKHFSFQAHLWRRGLCYTQEEGKIMREASGRKCRKKQERGEEEKLNN